MSPFNATRNVSASASRLKKQRLCEAPTTTTNGGRTEMNTQRRLKSEALESRICLAATAVVDNGDLVVSGDAEADIEIVAVGTGAYQVSEGGVVIADTTELLGVTDDIRIDLDEPIGGANSNVILDLGNEAVDRVYADLGDGDNTLVVIGGDATSIIYRGGDGVDDVEINLTIDRFAWIRLGDGDNNLAVNGDVGRLSVRGGDDVDNVVLSESSTFDSVSVRLGDGSNELSHAGAIDGRLKVTGGDGDDIVTVEEGASVGRNLSFRLGDGTNSASVDGSVGGSLGFKSGDGNDILTVSESAEILNNVYSKLGDGENTVAVEAAVGGDLNVVSANAEDESRMSVNESNVAGDVNLSPGEQSSGYYHFSPARGRTFRPFRSFRFVRR